MLNKVSAGVDIPNIINVIIEIPAHSDPVKYEVDKSTNTMVVDRFMTTPMRYPCNYGYIPNTLGEDNDPLDVLVVTPYPLISGSVIQCRPIGMLNMTDESGVDTKLLTVPIDKLTPLYTKIQAPSDLSPLNEQIEYFFEHYKDLEADKWVKVDGWDDAQAAKRVIEESIKRYTP